MRHGHGLIKSEKETHSILYGQECHKIGIKLGWILLEPVKLLRLSFWIRFAQWQCLIQHRGHHVAETLNKGLPNNPWLYSLKLQQDLKRVLVVLTEYNIKGNVRKGRYTKYPDFKKRERPLLVGSVKVSWRRWSLSLALKNKDDMAAYSNRQAGKHGGKLWIRSL